jgi:hypothetical protein
MQMKAPDMHPTVIVKRQSPDWDANEYRVTYRQSVMPDAKEREIMAYYTDNKEDAENTAVMMHDWLLANRPQSV